MDPAVPFALVHLGVICFLLFIIPIDYIDYLCTIIETQ